jgi:hypothetical protein
MRIYHLCSIILLAAALPALDAKDRKPKSDPKDSIEVVAHLPTSNGPVRRFTTSQHYSSQYLYVEHEAGRTVTLVDITNASDPLMLGEISYPTSGAESLVAATGTAALVTNQPASASTPPQSLRVMDFSDPKQPKVAREFTGVTAIARDEARRLIFLANSDGIWILHQTLAQDPEVEKAYDYYIRYGSSLYPRGK